MIPEQIAMGLAFPFPLLLKLYVSFQDFLL